EESRPDLTPLARLQRLSGDAGRVEEGPAPRALRLARAAHEPEPCGHARLRRAERRAPRVLRVRTDSGSARARRALAGRAAPQELAEPAQPVAGDESEERELEERTLQRALVAQVREERGASHGEPLVEGAR